MDIVSAAHTRLVNTLKIGVRFAQINYRPLEAESDDPWEAKVLTSSGWSLDTGQSPNEAVSNLLKTLSSFGTSLEVLGSGDYNPKYKRTTPLHVALTDALEAIDCQRLPYEDQSIAVHGGTGGGTPQLWFVLDRNRDDYAEINARTAASLLEGLRPSLSPQLNALHLAAVVLRDGA